MEVILLQDIKGTGKKGDIVDVSTGYAQNFLIKKGMAQQATNAARGELKAKQRAQAIAEKEAKELAEKNKQRLEEEPIEIKEKAAEDGRLFGSVTTMKIADEIKKQRGIKVDKRKIEQAMPMRAVGTQTVRIKLHKDVEAKVTVRVLGVEK
ncbi:50S ribosomal protein L9 [Allofustis seminis]|uniref:50S ribosomal protein L9 n=1 Tax=Allofustis seminis TaxID=166939 RepID=UPI0003635FD5|nr:50S ribosomal protein L9 [Allofustis seminis]